MDLIGKWKFCMARAGFGDGGEWCGEERLREMDAEEADSLTSAVYLFTEDGQLKTLMKIPAEALANPEMLEMARAQGVEIYGEYAAMKTTAWKEEDGKYYYDTQVKGEVLGQPVSPWCEIREWENGIELNPMLRLCRADD